MRSNSEAKHLLFIQIAELYAQQSTCVSLKVGCVITRENRIISTGYNGTVKDKQNCNEVWRYFDDGTRYNRGYENLKDVPYECHHDWSLDHEIHAELNAIIWARQDLSDCIMYLTHSPCGHCAKAIAAAGIKRVYYKNRYKYSSEGLIRYFGVYSEKI